MKTRSANMAAHLAVHAAIVATQRRRMRAHLPAMQQRFVELGQRGEPGLGQVSLCEVATAPASIGASSPDSQRFSRRPSDRRSL
jgi:hypothetical protein